jgi:hypothetical protein
MSISRCGPADAEVDRPRRDRDCMAQTLHRVATLHVEQDAEA